MAGTRGSGAFDGVTFTIGAEDTNVINVHAQLTLGGANVAEACSGICWITNTADPGSATTAHSTSPAIGTDGRLDVIVTDEVFRFVTESAGDFDVDYTDSGAQTVYMHVQLPDGSIATSGAITHAA